MGNYYGTENMSMRKCFVLHGVKFGWPSVHLQARSCTCSVEPLESVTQRQGKHCSKGSFLAHDCPFGKIRKNKRSKKDDPCERRTEPASDKNGQIRL